MQLVEIQGTCHILNLLCAHDMFLSNTLLGERPSMCCQAKFFSLMTSGTSCKIILDIKMLRMERWLSGQENSLSFERIGIELPLSNSQPPVIPASVLGDPMPSGL